MNPIPAYTIVIPARYASSRFPGKPLHPLNGRAMLLHVVDRARESGAQRIVVATDDERISSVCKADDVDVMMTRADHPSGTDRIAEVAEKLALPDDTIIVGLQGDEPATPKSHLDLLAQNLSRLDHADMATLCVAIKSKQDYLNPDRVKVVRDDNGMALYFSRASIPALRDLNSSAGSNESTNESNVHFPASFIHVGLYAYRRSFLKRYTTMPACQIESDEQLEQLRVLYHGGRIHVAEVEATEAHGVDRPEDVAMVEKLLPGKN